MSEHELSNLTIVLDSDNIYYDDLLNQIKSVNDNLIFYYKYQVD